MYFMGPDSVGRWALRPGVCVLVWGYVPGRWRKRDCAEGGGERPASLPQWSQLTLGRHRRQGGSLERSLCFWIIREQPTGNPRACSCHEASRQLNQRPRASQAQSAGMSCHRHIHGDGSRCLSVRMVPGQALSLALPSGCFFSMSIL